MKGVDLSALKSEFGIENFVLNRDGVEAIKARTYEPTANIQGMISGYTGPGHKTIVPIEAKRTNRFSFTSKYESTKMYKKTKKSFD